METIDLDWHTYSPHWDSWHSKRHLDGLSTENIDWLAAWAENVWIDSRLCYVTISVVVAFGVESINIS